jgi:hypothetical protein
VERGSGLNQCHQTQQIITVLTQYVNNGWMDSTNIDHYDVLWCSNKRRIMKEIDQKLNQWIYNSIIRTEIRELIVKEINKYKLNTNTNG